MDLKRRRSLMADNNITMIEPLFLGYERLQDVIIPENSITGARDAVLFVENLMGLSDNYVVSILNNPTIDNQLLSWSKRDGQYFTSYDYYNRRYRNGTIGNFGVGNEYDARLVQGTKYAIYKINYSTVIDPY